MVPFLIYQLTDRFFIFKFRVLNLYSMFDVFKKIRTETKVYLVIVLLLVIFIFFERERYDKLELKVSESKSQIDSLNLQHTLSDKIVELNMEILQETNKNLIKKKEKYEDKISTLDSIDLEHRYEENLRTIREYIEDRERLSKNK